MQFLLGGVILTWSFVAMLGTAKAQQTDPVEMGAEALKGGKFPWYESDSNTAQPVESPNTKSAASANRRLVRAKKVQPVATPTSWSGWFQQLFDGLSYTAYILLTLVAAVLVSLLIWGYIRFRPSEMSKTDRQKLEETEAMSDRIQELPFTVSRQLNDHFEDRARAAADTGNYAEAVMLLFSFILLSLDRKGLIRLRRGTTNRQYLNEIRHHDRLPEFYNQVMVPFEKSFFGGHRIDQETFEKCWQNVESFRHSLN